MLPCYVFDSSPSYARPSLSPITRAILSSYAQLILRICAGERQGALIHRSDAVDFCTAAFHIMCVHRPFDLSSYSIAARRVHVHPLRSIEFSTFSHSLLRSTCCRVPSLPFVKYALCSTISSSRREIVILPMLPSFAHHSTSPNGF
jgi:hypothetical protein